MIRQLPQNLPRAQLPAHFLIRLLLGIHRVVTAHHKEILVVFPGQQRIQLPVRPEHKRFRQAGGKAQGVGAVLPHPYPRRRVIYQQLPCPFLILHGQVQPVPAYPRHRVFVALRPQRRGYARHLAVRVYAYVKHALVVQVFIHPYRAFVASLLHPPQVVHVYREVGWLCAVYPVQTVFLEENHRAAAHRRPREGPRRPHRHRIAVRGYALVRPPVGGVAQLAAVDFMVCRGAAPEPVVLLHHKIHLRAGPLHPHLPGLGQRLLQNARKQDVVRPRVREYPVPVQPAFLQPAHRHPVQGLQPLAQPRGAHQHIGGGLRNPYPLGLAPGFHHRRIPAGVQPQLPVFGILRRRAALRVLPVGRAVPLGQGHAHRAAAHVLLLHVHEG